MILMLENVVPSPSRSVRIDVSEIEKNFDELVQYDSKDFIMVAGSTIGTS